MNDATYVTAVGTAVTGLVLALAQLIRALNGTRENDETAARDPHEHAVSAT